MSKAFEWVNNVSPEKAFVAGFDDYLEDIRTAVRKLLLSYAPRIEAWMKENALWTDRTGNARQSLAAELVMMGDDFAIEFGFGNNIEYAKFLEFANAGRFAIVSRALDKFGAEIFADLQKLFRE